MTDASTDDPRPGRCPKCGRPLDTTTGAYAGPNWPGEVCSWCATGHGPGWASDWTEPGWFVGRWLNRFAHWLLSGPRGSQ